MEIQNSSDWTGTTRVDIQQETACIGCGQTAVVRIEDQDLCGHCFLSAVSFSRSAAGGGRQPSDDEARPGGDHLERALRSAVEEIQRLREKVDLLLQARTSASERRD